MSTQDCRDIAIRRVKVVTGHTALSRFMSEFSDEPIGYIPRQSQIPSPHSFSPVEVVYDWGGRSVFVHEVRHMRYEVYEIAHGTVEPNEDVLVDRMEREGYFRMEREGRSAK